jgi:hypothetical protein
MCQPTRDLHAASDIEVRLLQTSTRAAFSVQSIEVPRRDFDGTGDHFDATRPRYAGGQSHGLRRNRKPRHGPCAMSCRATRMQRIRKRSPRHPSHVAPNHSSARAARCSSTTLATSTTVLRARVFISFIEKYRRRCSLVGTFNRFVIIHAIACSTNP